MILFVLATQQKKAAAEKGRINMLVDPETFKKLDDFRFAQRFETRTEAVLWLLRAALDKGLVPNKK